jgi:hypothetical protein
MSLVSDRPNLEELYRARAQRFAEQARRLEARSALLANLRGLSFGSLVIASAFLLFGSEPLIAALVAGLSLVAFLVLVVVHARVINAEDDSKRWMLVNQLGERRVTGRWRRLPEDGRAFAEDGHPYADDLDLFGPASLFQRISVAHTKFGQARLAEMLRTPAASETIRLRQEAAQALAGELEIRQRLQALGLALVDRTRSLLEDDEQASTLRASRQRKGADGLPDPELLLRWAESGPRLAHKPWLVWTSRVLPIVTLLGVSSVYLFGAPHLSWTIPLLFQVVLVFKTRAETAEIFTAVSSTEGAFLRYGAMLELVERLNLDSALIQSLKRDLLSGERPPSVSMKEFRSKVGWFDLRHNGLVHPFAALLLLWDIHCVLALESWQRRSGAKARAWLLALGEIEALSSFGTLAYEEPGFTFPEISDGPAVYVARELGHPLIDADQRVANDVNLPEPGSALLVTGSNMSGKSTLLRAMGLSAVMAFAGAPVCARHLRIAPASIRTSIRIRDSLEAGVSHFYAELHKLKAVLDATRDAKPVLFLLDEILHGTNSRERQIGARWLLGELLERNALGAVSTHDMGLCRLPEERLQRRVIMVHFRENVEHGKMTFDYRLRSGPVTAGNALRLMQLIGLAVPLPAEESQSAAMLEGTD